MWERTTKARRLDSTSTSKPHLIGIQSHVQNTPSIEHQVEVATNDRRNPNAREAETEIAAPLSLMIRFQMYLLTFVSLN
jgi:hypothetical protein